MTIDLTFIGIVVGMVVAIIGLTPLIVWLGISNLPRSNEPKLWTIVFTAIGTLIFAMSFATLANRIGFTVNYGG